MFGCPESISMLSGCDSQPVAPDSEGGDGDQPCLRALGLIKKPQLNEEGRRVG